MSHRPGSSAGSSRVVVSSCTHTKTVFELHQTDTSIANALRRVIISEVPTLAIDEVEFDVNTSPLEDEFIAHRLGLLPLSSIVAESMRFTWDCGVCDTGRSCPSCSVTFTLDERCITDQPLDITSDMLRSDNPAVTCVHDEHVPGSDLRNKGILIAKLGKDQHLKLTAIARKGIGKDHAKFSPVATAVYKFVPDVKVNSQLARKLTPVQVSQIVNCCPAKVFSESKGDSAALVVERKGDCMYCNECLEVVKDVAKRDSSMFELLSIRPKEHLHKSRDGSSHDSISHDFIFTVEGTHAIPSVEVVRRGFQVLKAKFQGLLLAMDQY